MSANLLRSEQTLGLVRAGRLPVRMLDNRIRIPDAVIDVFLAELPTTYAPTGSYSTASTIAGGKHEATGRVAFVRCRPARN